MEEDEACEAYGHEDRVVDEECGQWVCDRCGAEGWDE